MKLSRATRFAALSLLCGLAWLAGLCGGAGAAGCPAPTAPPALSVTVDYGSIFYDLDHSSAELGWIERQQGGMAHGEHPLGLTVSTFTTDGRSETDTRRIAQGWCAYPRDMSLRVGFVSHRIYIDRRFPPGSCMYGAVLAHEQEHVRIARTALARHEGEIRRAVEGFLRGNPVLLVADEAAARQAYLDRLKGVLDPVLARLDAEANAGHARLDAPASLDRTRMACPAW